MEIVHCKVIQYLYFYKKHFYKQHQIEIGKKKAKAKQHPEAKLLTKNVQINTCGCFNEIICNCNETENDNEK